jgi:hypothetical protein
LLQSEQTENDWLVHALSNNPDDNVKTMLTSCAILVHQIVISVFINDDLKKNAF